MSDITSQTWEERLRAAARATPYPPTPDVAPAVRQQLAAPPQRRAFRLAASAAALAALLTAVLLLVPPARAAVLEFLQIGAVRIFPAGNAPVPTALPASPPLHLNLSGETTLKGAEQQAGFAAPLPAYPPEVGQPDHVFFQDLGGPAVILVWTRPDTPSQVWFSLHVLADDAFVMKMQPNIVQETEVNGQWALWTAGPYIVRSRSGEYEAQRLVEGNVLIWQAPPYTYRLEIDAPLSEAVRIAESLPFAP